MKVLLVEDDRMQRETLARFLKAKGMDVVGVGTGKEVLGKLDWDPDVVVLDWKLPDMDGLEVFEKIKDSKPLLPVVMLTAFASVENAVEAMRMGAFHYLSKPVNLEELLIILNRAYSQHKLHREVESLRVKLRELTLPSELGVIAESDAMKRVLSLVGKVAPTDATVLVTGESGTGKEVVASLVHKLSPRATGPFVKVNCAAIPENLLEAELFGYEKGAFTGAHKAKPGLFEEADGGTIFLDEVGELPLALQAKLLRVLQDRSVRRVGGNREKKVDVRVVTATNRDLEEMVREGIFREDLYWRLNVFSIHIPPLRERKEDILPLAETFLKRFSQKYGKVLKGFTREAKEFLLTYSFPGNVRELENMVERAVVLSDEEYLDVSDLRVSGSAGDITDALFSLPLDEAVELLERERIKKALETTGGNKSKAARMLGISERVLRYKVKKYFEDQVDQA